MTNFIVPIFHLDLTLLPGEEIELHIFEERYKAMFNDIGNKYPVGGILRVKKGKKSSIGTTFELIEVLNLYESGEKDVLIRGVEVFKMETLQPEPYNEQYPVADVEILGSEFESSLPESLLTIANRMLQVASGNDNRPWSPRVNIKEILFMLKLDSEQKEELLRRIVQENWIDFLRAQMLIYIVTQNQIRLLKGNYSLN